MRSIVLSRLYSITRFSLKYLTYAGTRIRNLSLELLKAGRKFVPKLSRTTPQTVPVPFRIGAALPYLP